MENISVMTGISRLIKRVEARKGGKKDKDKHGDRRVGPDWSRSSLCVTRMYAGPLRDIQGSSYASVYVLAYIVPASPVQCCQLVTTRMTFQLKLCDSLGKYLLGSRRLIIRRRNKLTSRMHVGESAVLCLELIEELFPIMN